MSTGGQQTPPRESRPIGDVQDPPPHAPMARPLGYPSEDERLFGAAAHGLSFVEGGVFGPLVVYLLKKNDSEFVAFHALQSLYFGLAFLLVTFVTCGLGALVLVWPYLIYEGIAVLRAYEGQWYQLPIVGKHARARHPGDAPRS